MMKQIFFRILIALLYSFIYLNAVNASHLVLFLSSGTSVALPLTDKPKILFEGSVMTVGNENYQIDNVRKWMVGDPEAIEIDDAIIVILKEKGAPIKVFNSAGVEFPVSVQVDAKGKVQCNLNGLPRGVYVIQVGKETIKVTKR